MPQVIAGQQNVREGQSSEVLQVIAVMQAVGNADLLLAQNCSRSPTLFTGIVGVGGLIVSHVCSGQQNVPEGQSSEVLQIFAVMQAIGNADLLLAQNCSRSPLLFTGAAGAIAFSVTGLFSLAEARSEGFAAGLLVGVGLGFDSSLQTTPIPKHVSPSSHSSRFPLRHLVRQDVEAWTRLVPQKKVSVTSNSVDDDTSLVGGARGTVGLGVGLGVGHGVGLGTGLLVGFGVAVSFSSTPLQASPTIKHLRPLWQIPSAQSYPFRLQLL